MPAKGYAGMAITQPTLSCNTGALSNSTFTNAPASWSNPAKGTYNVGATAACGGATNITAACGTLNVVDQPTLTCNISQASVFEGVAVTQPTVTCSDAATPTERSWEGFYPNWSNPAPGNYWVEAKANCGAGILTAECGDLEVKAAALSCTGLASSGYATRPVTQPTLVCNNGQTATSISWLGTAINWASRAVNTYTIGVSVNCGTAAVSNSCGTLTINPLPTLSCTGLSSSPVYAGVAITPPTVTCSNNPLTGQGWTNAPNWSNPVANTYNISATGTCDGISGLTASCGSLVVNPRPTLSCDMAKTGVAGVAVAQPTATCSNGATPSGFSIKGAVLPTWSSPAEGSYAVSVDADCGLGVISASCGTLVVEPVKLTCGAVPSSGISGTAITPPLTCNNGLTTGANWTNAPTWSNPAPGTYSNISVTADCGSVTGLTANCSGTLNVACKPSDNTQTHYCSNGEWRRYGTLIDTRDNDKAYKTVVIGAQTWMAENLNYNVTGSRCYDNNIANCATYGRLYDWATALTVCPSGWHLPSDAEWTTLADFVGGNPQTKLKATSGWGSNNGTDDYGFSALPGGASATNGNFYYVGDRGMWFSSSEFETTSVWIRYMYASSLFNFRGSYGKSDRLSVRCLKD